MKLNVTRDSVSMQKYEYVNTGEVNSRNIYFNFSDEYKNTINYAVFKREQENYIAKVENDYVTVPIEACKHAGKMKIGVYGYTEDEQGNVTLRYSPKPCDAIVREGSYEDGKESTTIVAESDFEQQIRKYNENAEQQKAKLEEETTKNIEKINNVKSEQDNKIAQIEQSNNSLIEKVSQIQNIIPNQANTENQLADKDFVNSSIATNTATFKGTFNTLTELKETNADVNDYGNVITIEEGQTYYNRYTFDGEKWIFNFKINNTTFTAEQWKALNSKATEDLISQISTNKENVEKHEGRIKLLENDNISNKEKIETNTNSILQNSSSIARSEESRTHLYGIRRKINGNSSSEWERLYDSIGLVANATKDGTEVKNDFDNLSPWNQIISYNINLSTKKTTALYGDDNFTFDGSNGDVYTYYPNTWWKIFQKNGYDYILLSDSPRSGFKEMPAFSIARYTSSITDDGLLHSYSNLVPTTDKNINQFRILAQNLGEEFSLLDWRYFIVQLLYLVEYADYNSQKKLGNGITNREWSTALVAETNTNRVVVSHSKFYIGEIIRIGTSNNGKQIADAREITAIDKYEDTENNISGYSLTFSGDAVDIAIGNYVNTMAQKSGQCDSLGMKSGCLNNDNYHSIIYRGVENVFSNIWQFVDGINVKDHVAYICKEHSKYKSDVFESPYKALGYTNLLSNGWVKALGFDLDEPFFRFPTEVGGSNSNYMTDYYWQGIGNRVAIVGGFFADGAHDGLWYWSLGLGLGGANSSIGARVLIDKPD